MLQTVAATMGIALENARLFNETKEALERQTATSEVLRVISSSPSDLEPVYRTILESITRLCESQIAVLFLFDGERLSAAASHGTTTEFADLLRRGRPKPSHETTTRLAALERRTVHVADLLSDATFSPTPRDLYERENVRTVLSVPMLRDTTLIGVMTTWRREVRPFDERQIGLIQTFADQAVIAIENVRLFNETKEALHKVEERTAELTEALDYQTAISQVLRVISESPTDVVPVFEAILESATRLFGEPLAAALRFDGKLVHLVATHNWPTAAVVDAERLYPAPPNPKMMSGRVILSGRVNVEADTFLDPDYDQTAAHAGGWRRMLGAPLLKDGAPIGAIVLAWPDPGATPQRQIDLLKTFADQAVIAIENVRLLNETREALERQTATANVLKAISRSTFDLGAVLETLISTAARLCRASLGVIFKIEGDVCRPAGLFGATPALIEHLAAHPPLLSDQVSLTSRAVTGRQAIQVEDALTDLGYGRKDVQQVGGYRTLLAVPIMREGEAIGVLSLGRTYVQAYNEKEIDLVTSFADQAAIAMENVRLFNETKEALEQQTATAEVLQVISRSTFDLAPVFDALVQNAARLCGAKTGAIFRRDGDLMRAAAWEGASAAMVEFLRPSHRIALDRRTATGRAASEGRTIQVLDAMNDPEYSYGGQAIENYRTIIGVPLMRNGEAIGVFTLWRHHVEAFSPRQIALVETFADQAVIAIENVRLFNETKEALERETATAEILRVISQSPTDVRPVFNAIVVTAVKLIASDSAFLMRCNGNTFSVVAWATPDGLMPDMGFGAMPVDPTANFPSRAIVEKKVLHLPDWSAIELPEHERNVRDNFGVNAGLYLPLLRDGECIGLLSFGKNRAGAFSDQGDCAGRVFPRPGRDRDRERAAVQRDPGGAGAADGHRRSAGGDQRLGGRHAAGVRQDSAELQEAVRQLRARHRPRHAGGPCHAGRPPRLGAGDSAGDL